MGANGDNMKSHCGVNCMGLRYMCCVVQFGRWSHPIRYRDESKDMSDEL